MKYLKCVKQLHPERETNFKLDVIYELIQEDGDDIITSTDTDLGEGEPWTYHTTKDEFQEWIEDWYLFEEVTYEDYVLQEFVNGRIAVQFENNNACEYWNKRLLPKVNNPIRYSMSTTKVNSRFRYYVDRGENRLKFDTGNEYLKVVVLSIPEENKKENENMKKEFTKSDLVNGMVVETRNEYFYLVHNKFLLSKSGNSNLYVRDYNDNLRDCDTKGYDIMKIYESLSDDLNGIFDEENLELVWERDETKDLTEKEYKFDLLTISPNGDSYLEDEDDEIFIKKENIYDICDSSYIAISLEEAKFMIESLTEIVNTIENN